MADFPYRIASYKLGARSPDALEALRQALREQTGDSLRARSSARRFNNLLAAANVALANGAFADLEQTLARLSEADPTLPGTERSGRGVPTASVLGPFRAAMSAGLGEDEKATEAEIRSTIKQLEALPGDVGRDVRRQAVHIVYAAFMVTRDTTFLTTIQRWSGEKPTATLLALAAIEAGDTAGARRIAQQFPRGDTTAVITYNRDAGSRLVEAEVLMRLGDLRGALGSLETLDPKRFTAIDLDPNWAFYPRTLMQRADLHERLGEPDRAAALYTQVTELWKDADAKGQALVSLAQARLSALRDRPASVPVVRPR